MHHNIKRIENFVTYYRGIQPIDYGDFILQAESDATLLGQGQWAVNCSLDRIPLPRLLPLIHKHQFEKNCVFFFSDPDIVEQYRHLNFRYFPYFIAEGISQVRTASELENPPISFASRPNILSCANRVIRPHRLYTFYRLSQYSKLRQAAVSFTRLANRIQGHDVMINLMDFEEMCAVAEQHHFHSDEFRAWLAEVFPRLPISIEDFDVSDNKSDNWVNSRAFSGSYANIVTETELVSFVPTEKVVKSMLAGCLIYMVGSDLFMTKLQRMGFDLNFQGIDYEKYDHYQHWQLRINTVLEMVNDAYDDLPEIWLLNRARLEHNRNLFFSQQLVDHVISDVTDIFKLC